MKTKQSTAKATKTVRVTVKMENPHIVIGPHRRCLCGQYGAKEITCGEIIAGLKRSAEPVKVALTSMVQECMLPFELKAGLADQASELCAEIEALPASEQQTALSVKAARLAQDLRSQNL